MEVKIKLFGNLGHYLPPGGNRTSLIRSFPDGTNVAEMLKEIGLAGKTVVIAVVNNTAVDSGYVLKEGDEVSLLRPSGGG
jgi:molybdopterin converting factor small subunit